MDIANTLQNPKETDFIPICDDDWQMTAFQVKHG